MARFTCFADFYPYYLSEHANPLCRALHYLGSSLVLVVLFWAVLTQQWLWLFSLPVIGYGFAWLGHLLFEHNKPATFDYPFYSLAADWVMYKDFLTGQLSGKLQHLARASPPS
ncbi:DUF962 domain-containing protein [Rheinheimera sp. UJ51]|uniref:DUF962 domain-containing protein n=1 Tax=unclassified Rheinheimera TaxID=115860 RepID=UPI001E435277|nr:MULTISPECIES: DUF962 domain-containing protein [unclassified Rheinheimera]MCC5451562.1 DUF962 domain-containing protein [Rheinheimera sp. UJ51]MCF4008098.1 DUF962 domain-containing protein [Rheinheimera sp. UJ63]